MLPKTEIHSQWGRMERVYEEEHENMGLEMWVTLQ